MIERVFSNWKTTVAGVVLFLSGMLLVAFDKASLTEAGAFFGVAFALFYSKDSINGKRL